LKRKRSDASKVHAKKRVKIEGSKATTSEKSRAHMNGATNASIPRLHRSKSAPSFRTSNARHKQAAAKDVGAEEETDGDDERPSSALGTTHPKSLSILNSDVHVNEGVSQTAIAGKYIALDCEMVGYGPNPQSDSQLARVSIVNYHGEQIYDSYVTPQVPVTDYRTHITGLTATILNREGRPFKEVQRDVATFMSGRILVGHAIKNDLEMLMLPHPRRDIRDTSRHAPFRALSHGKTPALRKLCKELLGLDIQTGVHSSVEDARVTMLLYRKEKDVFEAENAGKFGRKALLDSAEGLENLAKRKKKKQKRGKR
jgi:RNA exonuclease 4